jgi:hydrogenase maturation protease
MSDAAAYIGNRGAIVVLGLGNLLRRDEGLGIRALERLRARYTLPDAVQLVDGGTLGLELLCYLEGAACVLILDAALTDGPPGTLLHSSYNAGGSTWPGEPHDENNTKGAASCTK